MQNNIYPRVSCLIIVLFLLTQIPTATSNSINQDSNDILYVGGAGAANYTTIQQAINEATKGDTIFIYNLSSPYVENIVIDKTVNLVGQDGNTTIIDGGANGDVIQIKADNVLLCNLTVRNSGIGNNLEFLFNSAVEVYSLNNTIRNLRCLDTNYGIWVEEGGYNTIIDNYMDAYYDGISLGETERNYLRNNEMYHSGLLCDGIQDIDTSNTLHNRPIYYYYNQSGIIVPQNASQVILVKCENCLLSNLNIYNSTDGIAIQHSNYNLICNNKIYNTTDFGIRLYKSNHNIIKNNEIKNNPIGIALMKDGFDGYQQNADCKYNKILKNNFTNSIYVGLILVMSNKNKIYENNFIENKINHARFICSHQNKWNNNYWDNWIGLKYPFLGLLPKIITGSPFKKIGWANLWFNLDMNPSPQPYKI